jgi:hypothetical protein
MAGVIIRRMVRGLAALFFVLLLLRTSPADAQTPAGDGSSAPPAPEFNAEEQIGKAKTYYEYGDYKKSVEQWNSIMPKLTGASRLDAYAYLGVCYMILNERDKMAMAFTLLVKEEPKYELDPVLFPPDAVISFNDIKKKVQEDIGGPQPPHNAAQKFLETPLYTKKSPALALMPFGVGQIQNGHYTKGYILMLAEGATSLVSIGMYLSRHKNEVQNDTYKNVSEEKARQDIQVYSGMLFWMLVVYGVADSIFYYSEPSADAVQLPSGARLTPNFTRNSFAMQLSVDF